MCERGEERVGKAEEKEECEAAWAEEEKRVGKAEDRGEVMLMLTLGPTHSRRNSPICS